MIRLHWWLEEIGRLSDGSPRHPVSKALEPIINSNPLILDYIKQHFLCIESLLTNQNQLTSISEWKLHWFRTLGQFWLCTEKAIGKENNNDLIIRNGGIIFTLDILQSFYLLSNKLPGFLPMDLLEKYGLQQEALKETKRQPQVCKMFGELVQDFSDELTSIYTLFKGKQRNVGLYHVIMNRISYSICKEILNDGNQIMKHKVTITPLRKLWISWYTKIRY